MKKQSFSMLMTAIMFVIMGIIVVGCSNESPLAPSSQQNTGPNITPQLSGGEIEFSGLVGEVDTLNNVIKLFDNETVIQVAPDAQVVVKQNGLETPISLSEIFICDQADVRGDMISADTLLADRVRIDRDWGAGTEIEVYGRVETIDPAARTIQLAGKDYIINVFLTAEIVRKTSGDETAITMADINPGDSLDVRGEMQTDGSLSADRVRLRENDDPLASDLEFTSIITSIDYDNGTFTVASRAETLVIDTSTFIFIKQANGSSETMVLAKQGSDDDGSDDNSDDPRVNVSLSFSHLMVGDSVEVYADVIDASMLLAVAIEIEDGQFEMNNDIEFKDFIASVNATTGEVTFQNQTWTGQVVGTTMLIGLMNEEITLADFAPGDIVEVHAFPTGETAVQIVKMEKDNNF